MSVECEAAPLPKVTVVTPSFNQGHFIEETIKSVITQDYPNLEYIIVDGGSTDNTLDIIAKYHDHIDYWISEEDTGQSNALNKGFALSHGEILAWLNSDDVYTPGAIRIAVEEMISSDVSLVYGDFFIINAEGRSLQAVTTPDFDRKLLLRYDFIGQPSTFFKKDALIEVGGLDETLHYSMDYDLWLRLSFDYKIKHIPFALSKFRVHGTSKTISHALNFYVDIIRMLEGIRADFPMPDQNDIFELYSQIFWSSLFLYQCEKAEDFLQQINLDLDLMAPLKKMSALLDQSSRDSSFYEVSIEILNSFQRKFEDPRITSQRVYENWYLLQLDRLLDHLNHRYMNNDPRVKSILLERFIQDGKILGNYRSWILLLKIIIPQRLKLIFKRVRECHAIII